MRRVANKVQVGDPLDAYLRIGGARFRLHAKNGSLYIWPNGYGQYGHRVWFDTGGAYVWFGCKYRAKIRIFAKCR